MVKAWLARPRSMSEILRSALKMVAFSAMGASVAKKSAKAQEHPRQRDKTHTPQHRTLAARFVHEWQTIESARLTLELLQSVYCRHAAFRAAHQTQRSMPARMCKRSGCGSGRASRLEWAPISGTRNVRTP